MIESCLWRLYYRSTDHNDNVANWDAAENSEGFNQQFNQQLLTVEWYLDNVSWPQRFIKKNTQSLLGGFWDIDLLNTDTSFGEGGG